MQITAQPVDHGTQHRLDRGDFVIVNNRAQTRSDPHRIDELKRRCVLTDMEHHECVKLLTLWHRAGRQPYRAHVIKERVSGSKRHSYDGALVNQMDAQEEYYFIMGNMRQTHAKLLSLVVFEEITLRDAARQVATFRNGMERHMMKEAVADLMQQFDALYDLQNPKESTCAGTENHV